MRPYILAALVPLITTGGALTLRGIFPRLDAGVAIFIAGYVAALAAIWLAKDNNNGQNN